MFQGLKVYWKWKRCLQIIFIFTLSALTKNNGLLTACFNRWWLVLAEKGVVNIDPAILTYVQLLLVKGNKDYRDYLYFLKIISCQSERGLH